MSGKGLYIEAATPYYDKFMYELRFLSDAKKSFIEQDVPTYEEHLEYLDKNRQYYYIAIEGEEPVGYIGVIDNDIRFAVVKEARGKGIGGLMLTYIKIKYPMCRGKIFEWNTPSRRAFEKAEIPYIVLQEHQA